MFIFHQTIDLQNFLKDKKDIGFVPTMGALHQGHISLIQQAKEISSIVVCSIFVNPTQFNNKEDFDKYPNTLAADLIKLEQAACDVLFIPSVEEIYPKDYITEEFNLGGLDHLLEGEMRPGHYQGVAQVVYRLLQIVHPDKMFMGLKDYQQIMVVKQMLANKHLSTAVVSCETEREESGLAMSSRNMRLTDADRLKATSISETLQWIKNHHRTSTWQELEKAGRSRLEKVSDQVEYLVIRDASNLLELTPTSKQAVVLVAAWFGGVRLIDNMTYSLEGLKKI